MDFIRMPVNDGALIKLAVELLIANPHGDNYTIGEWLASINPNQRASCAPENLFVSY